MFSIEMIFRTKTRSRPFVVLWQNHEPPMPHQGTTEHQMIPSLYPCSFCNRSPAPECSNASGEKQSGRIGTICEDCARRACISFDRWRQDELAQWHWKREQAAKP
jgi:hypothetical protein